MTLSPSSPSPPLRGRGLLAAPLLRFLGRLRFPWLFALTAGLFVLDLVIPDVIPLADELLLGMATLLLGSWKRRKKDRHRDLLPRAR